MGKIKSLIMDYQDHYGYDISIDEADLYEYHHMCHLEAISEGRAVYQLNYLEEQAYNDYMEGKLCGEHQNTAHTDTDTNSKDGRTIFGLRGKRNTPK